MLKLAENSERLILPLQDAFGTKAGGLTAAYGCDSPVLQVWTDGDASAVVRLDGAMTLCCTDKTDYDELSAFINAVGCSSLFASRACLEKLSIEYDSYGSVMKCESFSDYNVSDGRDRLREIYELISLSIPDSFPIDSYKYWLSDFTYRQRRSLARARCVDFNGEIAACALTSAETPFAAVISGVASGENYRGSGLGKTVVCSLAYELHSEGKEVYVFVLNKKAQGFYEHIGFSCVDEWAQVHFK